MKLQILTGLCLPGDDTKAYKNQFHDYTWSDWSVSVYTVPS